MYASLDTIDIQLEAEPPEFLSRAIVAAGAELWVGNPGTSGTLPFTYDAQFQGERATVNPLGKALKFIRAPGDGEEPSALVRAILASP